MRSAFVLLLLIIPICLLSQDKQLRLPIKIHDGFGPFEYYGFFPVDWNTDSTEKAELLRNAYPDLKGIPPGLKNIRKTVIVFSYRQFLYQSFLAGKISKEKFIKFKEESRWIPDEKELGKEEMKCYVSIINGEDKEGKQVFILDANNNLDMSDDKIFIPADSKISEKELLKYISKIPIERKDGNKIIVDTASILVVLGGKKNLLFTMAEYATANLIIDKKSYQLLAYSNSFLGVSYLKTQMVVWADSMRTKKVSDDVLVNDSGFVFLNKQMFRYNGIDIIKKELILEKVDERNYVSPQIGFYAPAISGTDVLSGTGLVLEAFKGKYVFIDFWGTWCGPCIEELPTLKQVFQKIDKNRVQMLSVATSDNVLNLKKFLKKIAIKWPQILSDETAERYSINAYPTNFLVDPKGKIIAKNLHVKDLLREINELTARED